MADDLLLETGGTDALLLESGGSDALLLESGGEDGDVTWLGITEGGTGTGARGGLPSGSST